MDRKIDSEKAIRGLVKSNMKTFAQTFSKRHISEIDEYKKNADIIKNALDVSINEMFGYKVA